MILAGALLLIWLAFNWLAPLATLSTAEPMSLGRIPEQFVPLAAKLRARFYVSRLYRGPGFSAWVWPQHIIVLDRGFLSGLTPEHVRFVLGHELGHVALGHLRTRWLLVVTGLIALPPARRRLVAHEHEADAYAERLTGFKREFFDAPRGGGNANGIESAVVYRR